MSKKMKIAAILSVAAGLILIAGAYLWHNASRSATTRKYTGPVEKITISTSNNLKSILLFVAQQKGFFANQGLEVTINIFLSGKAGLDQLLAGNVDIANIAEYVLVEQIFTEKKTLKCLGSIASANDIYIIARKDKKIIAPRDLKGKKIGIPLRTNAEFFLGRFLSFHRLSSRDVTMVNLPPDEMASALKNGQVDGVIIWQPNVYHLEKDDNLIYWPGQTGQNYYWLLVGSEEYIKARPEALERLFRALDQAETFIRNNPEESIAITAQQMNLDPAKLKSQWSDNKFTLSLTQGLLLAMEDEERWIIDDNLTDKKLEQNYLNYIDAAPLRKVKPESISMITVTPKSSESRTSQEDK